ncbi:MAG: AAA family ATPase [Eubacteriales bacterium]|nr:AAA family ATPase [Eubacteriales bacterium]
MNNGIRELYIRDYKGIHDLTLSKLEKINILTGSNNSGKTSILELIYTVDQPDAIRKWLLGARIEGDYSSLTLFEGLNNLFPADKDEKAFSYSFTDSMGKLNSVDAAGTLIEEQLSQTQIEKINGFMASAKSSRTDHIYRDVHGLQLSIRKNGEELVNDTVYDFQYRILSTPIKKKSNVVYLSPFAHQDFSKYLNEILSNYEYYGRMIDLLQIFDSDIAGINAIKSERLHSTSYQLMSKAFGKTLPVSAYGDGMKKAIVLLGALIEAKDGILLVDEFETGIHTSAMDKVFKVLLDGAEKFNVQIFLSSHSEEAINKVLKLEHSMHEQMNLYTLYKHNGKNYVRCLDAAHAVVARDSYGMELR